MSEVKDPSIKPQEEAEAEEQKMEQELIEEGSSTEMKELETILDLIKSNGTELGGLIIRCACDAKIIKVDDGVKEQIMLALSARNPGENIIGLYGSDTKVQAAVKMATRRAQRDQLFQQIVEVNMTNKPHHRNIQSQIGAAIGLSFDDDDEPDPACFVFLAKNKRMSTAERASLLCAKMKERETVLVVLYDLHGSLDLDKVGIPFAEDHKGCKILLTSSSHDVLSNKMKAHVLIEVW